MFCPKCGAQVPDNAQFCGSCGAQLPQVQFVRPVLRKHGAIALALGLIPGFFNIFGLGHLVMREWSKGAMFLAMSVILIYVNGGLISTSFLMSILSVAVYFYQCMDLIRAVYSPEVH